MRSRVELLEQIRRDRRLEDLYPVRPRPAIDQWAPVIDGWPGGFGSVWSPSIGPRARR